MSFFGRMQMQSAPMKSRRLNNRKPSLEIEDNDRPDFNVADFDFNLGSTTDTFSIEPKVLRTSTPKAQNRRLKNARTETGPGLGRQKSRKGSGRDSGSKRGSARGSALIRKSGRDSPRGSIKRTEKKISLDSLDINRFMTGAVIRQKKELKSTKPVLGMECTPKPGKGLIIDCCETGKPIFHAGMRQGDLITHVMGEFCDNRKTFFKTYHDLQPGDDLMLKVARDGTSMTLRVVVGAEGYSTEQIMKIRSISASEHCTTKSRLEKIEAARKKLKNMKVSIGMMIKATPHEINGLEVDDVDKDGAAGKAGILKGDVMIKLKSKTIKDTTSFFDIYQTLEPGEKVRVRMIRNGREVDLTVRIGANGFTLKEVKKTYKLAKSADFEVLKAQAAMSPPKNERTNIPCGVAGGITVTSTKTSSVTALKIIEESHDFVNFGIPDDVGKLAAPSQKKDDRFSFSTVARRN